MTRGQLLSPFENFRAVNVRLQHLNSGESTTKSASLPIAISPLSVRPASRAGLRDAIAIALAKGTSALRIIARTRSIKRDALPARVPLSARKQAPFFTIHFFPASWKVVSSARPAPAVASLTREILPTPFAQ